MQKIKVEISGMTPLLLNRFTEAAQQKATSGNKMAAVGDRGTPREQATEKLYVGLDGKTLIVPGPNLFRCLIEGGKFFKAGKKQITTQKSSMIPAALAMDELELPIKHKKPWEVDSRPVCIPSTGGRILAHRPMFPEWSLSFTLQLDTELMDSKILREIVDAAGKRVGLGDFRPDRKGPFGRFVVTNWKNGKAK